MTIEEAVGYLAVSETGCWEWTRAVSSSGYGNVWANGKNNLVHRAIYEHLRGPVGEGLELDHLCRNKRCANPDHLEPVTRSTNQRRGVGAAGINASKPCCPRCGSDYSFRGDGRRYCLACDHLGRKLGRDGQKTAAAARA